MLTMTNITYQGPFKGDCWTVAHSVNHLKTSPFSENCFKHADGHKIHTSLSLAAGSGPKVSPTEALNALLFT